MNVTDHHFMEGSDGLCSSGIGGGELCGRPRSEHLYQGRREEVPGTPNPGGSLDTPWPVPSEMDFDSWMRHGIEQGWCGPPVCSTHDGTPTTEAEDEQFDYVGDPCIHIVRLYEDAEVKAGVEANHSPSVWRNHYGHTHPSREYLPGDAPPGGPGASVMDIVTGKVIHNPGKWADNFNKKDS